jgi:hypothetical protein
MQKLPEGERKRRRAEYMQKKLARQRAIIQTIKLTAGCADCGYKEHPEALDFDHVRGEKLFNISMKAIGSLKRLLAEIEKCDVVCANCHRVRTAQRRSGR